MPSGRGIRLPRADRPDACGPARAAGPRIGARAGARGAGAAAAHAAAAARRSRRLAADRPADVLLGSAGQRAEGLHGHPINFDFEDADLRAVLRVFANESGLNMIIDPQVQGRVNILLTDVPWDQALDQILRANKLGYTVEGNILRIAPLAVLADEQAEQQQAGEAKALAGELRVQTFPLSYAKANDDAAAAHPVGALAARQDPGRLTHEHADHHGPAGPPADGPAADRDARPAGAAGRSRGARGADDPRFRPRARHPVGASTAARTPAIGNTTGLAFPNSGSVGGRVSGTQGPNDPRGTGTADNAATAVNFPAAAASSAIGLALGSINGAFNLDVALTALENTGKGRILSTPRLTTQNNQRAEVAQGVQIPIQTVANNTVTVQFRDAVLSLKVTPQITMSNTVIMLIALQNATPDFSRQVNGIPPIDTQRANTTVQVNDGATTVIGGIFVSQEQSTNDRTPVLHRVPILKWLFQRNTLTDSSRELLIFITPRILRG